MAIAVTTSNGEKFFNKDVVNVGTNPNCDVILNLGYDIMLTLQMMGGKCTITNNFQSDKVLFKGQPIKRVEVASVCKLMFADSDEFVSVKILADEPAQPVKTVTSISKEDFTEDDIKGLYGKDVNAVTKVKLEKQKGDIESARVSIVKQVAFQINDLKNKLSGNTKTSIFLHIAMLFSAMICSFGVSNYLTGLNIKESADFIHLPTNIKIWVIYALLIYGVCLLLKQGTYLFVQNSIKREGFGSSKIGQNLMLFFSMVMILGVYVINLVYFMNIKDFVMFAIFISLFFTGIMAILAMACGYFKSSTSEYAVELDKYEYREDFEGVIKAYRQWIERYINSLSNTKLQNIKDKMFNLQLKSFGEIGIGLLTAPFLAYGVSNTLAQCFPEAAGWVRISGLRISPVFLVLATFMIIFAFFTFVNAFTCTKKVQGSDVIKQDGFSDYQHHGVTIYGLEGVRRLNFEKRRSFAIACSIIIIEFTMNVSYFMTEIGGDLQGLALSFMAALVPTAILIAETVMLSQTRFDIYACDELLSKVDKD